MSQNSQLLAHQGIPRATAQAGLLSLPVELLLDIHLLAVSPSLPLLNRFLRQLFSSVSEHHRAAFLFRHHFAPIIFHSHAAASEKRVQNGMAPQKAAVSFWWDAEIRHRCCNSPTILRLLCAFVATCYRKSPSWKPPNPANSHRDGELVRVKELPRHLFRRPSPGHPGAPSAPLAISRLDMIAALLRPPHKAHADGKRAYPLASAILSHDVRLARMLLAFGACPDSGEGLAVRIAVAKGDLEVVRMLVEPDFRVPCETNAEWDYVDRKISEEPAEGLKRKATAEPASTRRIDCNDPPPGKRRKLADRLEVTDKMLEIAIKKGHVDVARYLMARGATPTLRALTSIELEI